MTRIRIAIIIVALTLLTGPGRAIAAPTDNAGYPVFVHAGTCATLVEEPLADIGNALPLAAQGDINASTQTGNVSTASATVDLKFDDLRKQPHAIVVHESATNFSTIAACGDVNGTAVDGKLLIALYPAGGTEVIGVAILEEGSGVPVIGKDKTRITVYLVTGFTRPGPIPVPATPASDGTPVAGAPAIAGPVYTTGPVTIWLTDNGFVPDAVLSAEGHDLTVTLINSGTRPHGFVIDRLDINVQLAPGETKVVRIDNAVIGEYTYYSNLPDDQARGMTGQLSIFI